MRGEVTATWVVGATGLVDLTSFMIVNSAHPAFSAAVRDVLPRLRYTPAELGGHRVRVRVRRTFMFDPGKP